VKCYSAFNEVLLMKLK